MSIRKKRSCVRWLAIPMLLIVSNAPQADNENEKTGAQIIRDEYGVPHVYAKSDYSLWYAAGYAQAQDRLWQADMMRRTASGRMAELMGSTYLRGDIFARNYFGPDKTRTEMLEKSSASNQLQFRAFADGMNAWIQKAAKEGSLPVEYRAQGLLPEPWRAEDSVSVVQLIFGQFGEFGSDELNNAAALTELQQRLGSQSALAIFADTHWLNDANAETTIPTQGATTASTKITTPANFNDDMSRRIPEDWKKEEAEWKHNLEHVGIKGKAASNAIAIGPKLTGDRRTLLLGGPQMGYSSPQIALEMGLHFDDLHVTGISFAGLPGIAIGVTKHFAWSFTSGMSDNADFYVDPPTNLNCRIETIKVKGENDVQQNFCRNAHGAVFANSGNSIITLKRAAEGLEIVSVEALQKMILSSSLEEVDTAMANWAPNFNLMLADNKGNIGYWHLGKIPVRAAGDNPWFPHSGNGQFEWQGFVDWKIMPKVLNPEQGWLVNWNNKPREDWNNSTSGFGNWGPMHRVSTLSNLIKAQTPGTFTVDTLAHINRTAGQTTQTSSNEAHNVFVPTLLKLMLDNIDVSDDSNLQTIKQLLADWNGLQIDSDTDGRYDHPGVAIFNTWFDIFTRNVFGDELGSTYRKEIVANLTWRLIRTDAKQPLQYNYLGTQTAQQALREAFAQTASTLSAQYQSSSPNAWLQTAAYINWSPLGAVRVPQTPWMNRGTYNQIVHLGRETEMFGMNIVAPGQSGDPYNPHSTDQLASYVTWQYKPMRLNRVDLLGNTESITHLSTPR